MARKVRVVLLASLALLLLSACGGLAQEPVEFPYGKYRSSAGTRHLEFLSDGTWTFALVEGQPLLTGEIAVEGREITFGKETAMGGQNVPLCEEQATYRWDFDGEKLTFEVVGDDPCSNREGDLAARYTRVP